MTFNSIINLKKIDNDAIVLLLYSQYSNFCQVVPKTHALRDVDLIPGSERDPRVGNGNPLQYSCLENSMDGGARWATVHGAAKSQTRLSNWAQNKALQL